MEPQKASTSKIQLIVWMSVPAESQAYIKGVVKSFGDSNPTIDITLEFIPQLQYLDRLNQAVVSGQPPDVAALSYNAVLLLQAKAALVPLSPSNFDNWDDFLEDALQSNQFGGDYFAVPWRRYGTLPAYLNLSMFQVKGEQAGDRQKAAYMLLGYLTGASQQIKSYNFLKWYPTRKSAYGPIDIEPPATRVVLQINDPAVLSSVIRQVDERSKALQSQFGLQLDKAAPVALLNSMIMPSESAPAKSSAVSTADAPDQILFMAAPALSLPAESEYKRQADQGKPVLYGALFINQRTADIDLDPGDYALSYFEDSSGGEHCQAVRVGDGKAFDLGCQITQNALTVNQPVAVLLQGSNCLAFWIFCIGKRSCCQK